MAFVKTSAGHQSPQSSLPPLSQKQINTGTWGSGANTCVITDEYIRANSIVIVQVSGTGAQAAGQWSYVAGNGTLTITSSDSESSSLALTYVVL